MWCVWKITVLFYVLLVLHLSSIRGLVVRFEINEEVPIDTLVGSLATQIPGGNGNLIFIKVANSKDASRLFSVDKNTGKITVAGQLDRETLCIVSPHRKEEDSCELLFSVSCLSSTVEDGVGEVGGSRGTASSAVFAIADIIVTLRDINDNGCQFLPSETQTVYVPEDVDPDQTRIRLYVPTDPDSATLGHSVQWGQMRLEDQTGISSSVFKLYQNPIDDQLQSYSMTSRGGSSGKVQLFLGLLKPLDYEQTREYHLFVYADDGLKGDNHSCRLTVHVEVEDVNDNLPIFEKTAYNVIVAENTPFDQKVISVTAHDADAGDFSKIFYMIDPFLTDPATLALFRINEQNGDIFLKSRLNYHFSSKYQLTVRATNQIQGKQWSTNHEQEAEDPVYGKRRSYMAKVFITITDVNDHAPRMHIFSPTGSEKLSLTEGMPSGQDVAIVSVDDEDTGRNAQVDCNLKDQSIRGALILKPMQVDGITDETGSGRKYKILAMQSFDREQHATVQFTVECWDAGEPVMRTNQKGIIQILDINDNSPAFEKEQYNLEVYEDAQIARPESGVPLGSVRAIDADFGDNAKLYYQFSTECPLSFHELVKIDPESGTLHSTGRLDREVFTLLKCNVIVTDKGVPPLSSSVEVCIKILDVNDNTPMFNQPDYTFQLTENVPIGTLVGVARVFDPDFDTNSRIDFTIENSKNVWFSHSEMGSFFPGLRTSSGMTDSLSSSNSITSTQIPFLRHEVTQLKNQPRSSHPANWTLSSGGGGSLYEVRLFTSAQIDREALLKVTSDGGKFGSSLADYDGHIISPISNNESAAVVRFKIKAQDFGAPRLAQRASISLIVTDINDNYPTFIFPPMLAANTTEVRLSIKEPVGFQFTKISAYDPDAGENGTIGYRIRAGDPFDLFQLNERTGELFAAKEYTTGFLGNYLLFIEASDCGSPPLSSEAKLLVIMDDSQPLGKVERDLFGFPIGILSADAASSRSMNLYIIVAIIIASFVISTILLIAICFVVKRARRESRYHQVNHSATGTIRGGRGNGLQNTTLGRGSNGYIKTMHVPITTGTYTRNDAMEEEGISDVNYPYLTSPMGLPNGYAYEDGTNSFHSSYLTHDHNGTAAGGGLCHSILHEIPKFSIVSSGNSSSELRMTHFGIHQAQTIGRCSSQGQKKSVDDRLSGKRNSLTSADRDSGNGDSLDVAAAAAAAAAGGVSSANLSAGTALQPGARLFTLTGAGMQPGCIERKTSFRTGSPNGAQFASGASSLRGDPTGLRSPLGFPDHQVSSTGTLPTHLKSTHLYAMNMEMPNGDGGDQYIALELRPAATCSEVPLYRVPESGSIINHNAPNQSETFCSEALTTTFV